jgi:ferredoxin
VTAATGRNGGWTLLADLDLCQGHQMCVLDAPELFGFDEDADHVVVRDAHPADEHRAAADLAVRNCPAMALGVLESEVKED